MDMTILVLLPRMALATSLALGRLQGVPTFRVPVVLTMRRTRSWQTSASAPVEPRLAVIGVPPEGVTGQAPVVFGLEFDSQGQYSKSPVLVA